MVDPDNELKRKIEMLESVIKRTSQRSDKATWVLNVVVVAAAIGIIIAVVFFL